MADNSDNSDKNIAGAAGIISSFLVGEGYKVISFQDKKNRICGPTVKKTEETPSKEVPPKAKPRRKKPKDK